MTKLGWMNQDGDLIKKTELGRTGVTIGRGGDNTVSIDNLYVSRKHAAIKPTRGGGHAIVDLVSANGTFLNGERVGVSPRALRPSDRITLGQYDQLTLVYDPCTTLGQDPVPPDRLTRSKKAGLTVNPTTRQVCWQGTPLAQQITGKQYNILALLCRKGGQVCSYDEIARVGWPTKRDPVEPKEIHTYVSRIRGNLAKNDLARGLVENVPGQGYRLT